MLEVYTSGKIKSYLRHNLDVLICSASYENRSIAAAKLLNAEKVNHVIICESQDHLPLVANNAALMLDQFGMRAKRLGVYSTNPLKSADNISACLKGLVSSKPQRYLIDITTFTRECLMILLSLLRLRLKPTDSVKFIYTLAKDYSLGDSIENKWLAKGISEIRSVLAYPGEWRPSRKIHLIILVGLEYERAVKLIDSFEPATVSLGFSDDGEAIDLNKLGYNGIFYDNLKNSYLNIHGEFQFHCLDPIQTKEIILKQIKANPGYNVAIAPLNNKVSTVGASLAAFENKDIQLCYAQANQYNYENYSDPADRFILFEIPGFLISDMNFG